MITTGMFRNVFAASRLLIISSFNFDPPNISLAYVLFSQIQKPDVYSYNIIIKATSQSPNPLNSFPFYHKMLLQGLHPNEYTFCFLLTSCAHGLALQEGHQIHAHFITYGFDIGVYASTSLVHMYSECGDLSDAFGVFDEMRHRSDVTWSVMVDAYISRGLLIDGLQLFEEMMSLGVKDSNAVLVSALCACAKVQDLVLGRMVHGYIVVKGLELNVNLGTSLVGMYSKCGAIEMAMAVFSMMPAKSVGSWNCMINGLALNGCGNVAISLFKEMRAFGVEPNGVTFLGVLHGCSHAGLVDDAVTYFSCMSEVHGVAPNIKHYGCMVDLYCRAGRLEEALEVIRTMPIKPDIVIWGALLGACRIHSEAKLGELVGAQMMKLQPHQISGCTSLSDMYAMVGQWDGVIGVRRMMMDIDIGREPGHSSIT
ncbi:hypothetical protein HHK36_012211 [Tetracentron sinense]|uniref:Pentatricopeptide repeat-containing protein n=1 Tax=Tetracentron sinense TaxID=13715 RepID=A0A835DFB8_TETSI|nr:hypothetical protein HHK36_012211 [Tetracentron sinense]